MSHQDRPIALDAYEKLAASYSKIAESKAENGYNEHPAMREAIGVVSGLRVLDAGCGPGFLVRDLVKEGAATVFGFDVSPKMVEIAQERVGDQVNIFIHDLAEQVPLDDDSGDLVVSSLAMDYVRDWADPLREFRRLLIRGGRLLFSVQHPMSSYHWFKPPTAFGVHYCEASWKGFTEESTVVPDFYRSFEEIICPVIEARFRLRGVRETRPIEALREINSHKFERGTVFPTFLIIDAIAE